ncbi:MAG: polymer-forming cytoskeletal protein [Anaerolineales bacterium]
MFKKKEESTQKLEASSDQKRVTSVLGPGMSWKGELSGEGGVRVEGAFEGSMQIDGLIVVDQKGRITSEGIQAHSVIIAGAVRSDIKADRVEIRSTGRIWGNVVTSSFSTEEGAYLRGKIEMEEENEEAPEVESDEDQSAANVQDAG